MTSLGTKNASSVPGVESNLQDSGLFPKMNILTVSNALADIMQRSVWPAPSPLQVTVNYFLLLRHGLCVDSSGTSNPTVTLVDF